MPHVLPYHSPLGLLYVQASDQAITGAWFHDHPRIPADVNKHMPQATPLLRQAEQWLKAYFSGKQPGPLPPLQPKGSEFQQEVWKLLQQIPYGNTRTYGQLASKIAQHRASGKMSAQAVGNAISRNPISIFIPCHRVLGAQGSLVGYASGIARKQALLELEGILHYNPAS